MDKKNLRIEQQLNKRASLGNKRSLKLTDEKLVDFSSNDYLGLSRSEDLKTQILNAYEELAPKNGATGSRLLTGNSVLATQVESELATLFGFESCLVFNSGYTANMGFFSCLPQRGDTILYDELSHACIKDGSRLSLAKSMSFKHNDLEDLERKLKVSEGEIYIACEAVYSMDGDFAPLKALCELSGKYGAKLIVDEAHSTGVFAKNGAGLVAELGLTEQVYAVIFTFGKAMGIHGACVASNHTVIDYMINHSRPFIYTTAPSAFEFLSIREAFRFLESKPSLATDLKENISLFNQSLNFQRPPRHLSTSAVQVVITPGNQKAKSTSMQLQESGFDVRPILSPTVKEGEERLRICIHSFNSKNEVMGLVHGLNSLLC
ncbi:8-amino-7-oxononanoate synthase [Roseivirga sp.]|uniref:aminotransferase class I/II-fold pyridoxal phosphate-dependent enzyme n=1 Tax=Roseivirga sp. TaxID=1964215 RepID=UPI002B270D7E|nr:8-amino-7-oxononanoate synthase [Roseivirga sp.]